MKSQVKKIVLVCLAVALFAAIGVFIALNSLVHEGIETIGSDITRTDISLDSVRIQLLRGYAEMSGLIIGNPKGFSTPYALKCTTIAIDFEAPSVFGDTLIIKRIFIEGPEVMYETSLKGSNISVLSRTIDSYGRDNGSQEVSKKKQGSTVIERLLIKKGKIHIKAPPASNAGLTVALPEIEMKDIGREGQGMQVADIVTKVFSTLSGTVLTAVSSGSPLLQDATRSVGDVLTQGAKTGGESVKKVSCGIRGILGGSK